jgi:hypothetical protein
VRFFSLADKWLSWELKLMASFVIVLVNAVAAVDLFVIVVTDRRRKYRMVE